MAWDVLSRDVLSYIHFFYLMLLKTIFLVNDHINDIEYLNSRIS